MFFANGDYAVTYQQNEVIDPVVLKRLTNAFNTETHQYLTEIITTENTLTFMYAPIRVMESHDTIEPCGLVVGEAERFLAEKGFLK
ncbi:MAG TPA: hypothetical protein H9994_01475 [Candidatus Salinicoccus merdavium]|nr:hypothetical protein [Candidatus Salinicoccus merdavium]